MLLPYQILAQIKSKILQKSSCNPTASPGNSSIISTDRVQIEDLLDCCRVRGSNLRGQQKTSRSNHLNKMLSTQV